MHDWAPELRARLGALKIRPAREAEIVEELSQHLDDRREELISSGLDPDEATRATLAELRDADLLAVRLAPLRQARALEPVTPGVPGGRLLSGLVQDARCAVRTLRRQPGFAALAAGTLAIGIGLSTSMFSFMNTLLLRPLPFPDAERLVKVFRSTPGNPNGAFSASDYDALSREQAGFGRFAAYAPSGLTVSEPGWATDWLRVSIDLFDVLGAPPRLGRSFRPEEQTPGNDRVAVISHALWQHHFGGASDVIGQTLRGNGERYEIVGVLPAAAGDHRLFGQVGVFSPLVLRSEGAGRRTYDLAILGRGNADVTAEQGAAFIAAMGARLARDLPHENADTVWRSEELPRTATGPTGRAMLVMLLGLSGFLLLIACSNLANLLLARAIERTRELAVRTALGASRLQLVRILGLESLLLAVAGGSGALIVAAWTTSWLGSVIVSGGGPAFEFPLDWRVMSFALAASTLTLLLCGTVPVLFAGRIDTSEALKSGGRGASTGRRQQRTRHLLVMGQFALAMVLLAGAGFFVRGIASMLARHHGWNAEHVVQGEIVLPAAGHPDGASITASHRALTDRIEQVPGVVAASVSYGLPYLGLRGRGRYVGDGGTVSPGGPGVAATVNGVTPAYFEVTGTPLLAGRPFTHADNGMAPRVAIVSASLARVLFPGGDAVSRRVADTGAERPDWMQIVGVVADVRSIDVADDPAPFQLYQPAAQDPRHRAVLAARVSATAGPAVLGAIRTAIAEALRDVEVRELMPVETKMTQVTSQMHLARRLLTGFAVIGLFLAALGAYGAMTRMVAQRTEEIGVRMALGAQKRDVISLVLAAGARIVAIGAALGLLGAAGLSRLLASVLPGMQTSGALVAAAAVLCLAAIALGACYLPARRATTVDPMTALRGD